MIKRVAKKKLGRGNSHRNLMIRNLFKSLVLHTYLVTTQAKAKVLQSYTDRLFTLAKSTDDKVSAFNKINRLLNDKVITSKVLEVANDKFSDVTSGYTRRYLLENRVGDITFMARVEFVK